MPPRRKDPSRQHWPRNLYCTAGYYSWRDPRNGRRFGLGRITLDEAIAQAIEANTHVHEHEAERLITRLDTPRPPSTRARAGDRSVGDAIDRLERELPGRDLSPAYVKLQKVHGRAVREAIGDRKLTAIDTRTVMAELLAPLRDANKLNMAQARRHYCIELFRLAEAEGWIPRGSNPAEITRLPRPKVKRARLKWPEFQTIYAKALEDTHSPWIARSMELAIVTGQRREDLGTALFHFRPNARCYVQDRMLWVHQQKSGNRVRIPLDLRLDVLGLSLEDIIRRCRDQVVSHYLLHNLRNHGRAKAGSKVALDSLSRGFARTRDLTDLRWPDDVEPPSLHEIRSLSARLYTAQGINAQQLLGHKNAAMTEVYQDVRGAEWIDVQVA